MATTRDYYDILGVSKTSSASEIKSAYRKLALKWHPDRNKTKEAEEKFKEINQAYEVLSDSDKKAKYDQFGHAAFTGGAGNGPNPFQQGNPFGSYYSTGGSINFEDLFGGNGDFQDPFDVFSSFFGGNPFGGTQQRRASRPHYQIKVDFMDAVNGAEKTIVHQGKQYNISVPKGTDNGTRIRYNDFDVSFDIKPHPKFRREGYDVIVDYEIPFTQAILGGDAQVPTLDGDLKVRIRPGTQPNSVIRLTGKGIKHLQSNKKGDFYIKYIVKLPSRVSGKQKELLKKFEDIS